jgi:hypothetical protein
MRATPRDLPRQAELEVLPRMRALTVDLRAGKPPSAVTILMAIPVGGLDFLHLRLDYILRWFVQS